MDLECYGEQWKRTHRCGEVRTGDVGSRVVLAGWVKRVRELGGLTFLDLWDRTGLVQLVVEQENRALHELFHTLRAEDVIACEGVVRSRPANMINRDMKTGEIEVVVSRAAILNRSEVPPFTVTSDVNANEDLRLRYRYLDLRREPLQRNLQMRHELVLTTRNFLSEQGFIEIETPLLVRRTPEGARDYLVPSRLQPGKFYALPQSPQLYKQILMVAGFDRYFQIARCLRDEDLRADRQPEHTQIDIEMSFVTEEEIFGLVEKLIARVWRLIDFDVHIPFERMSYDEAMSMYGSDKPDLRFGLEIHDCSDVFRSGSFELFRSALGRGESVVGIAFGGGAGFSRKELDELQDVARRGGAKGLVWIKCSESGVSSPIAKFLGEQEVQHLREIFSASGPVLFLLIGGPRAEALRSMGEVRLHIGRTNLVSESDEFRFLWVNRFPLFFPAEKGGWEPAHHIFSMPLETDLAKLESDPGSVKGYLYDLVCNGTELGSGSIRVHRRELQERLFGIIGIPREEASKRFGFLLEAFQYGAPPHGGIALGVDRIAMLMGRGSSIRDFIAFPKTTSATSLMEGAPSEVEPELLRDLHIRIEKTE